MTTIDKVIASILGILLGITIIVSIGLFGYFLFWMYSNYPTDLATMVIMFVPLSYPFMFLYTAYQRTWKSVVFLLLFTTLLIAALNWSYSLGITYSSVINLFLEN